MDAIRTIRDDHRALAAVLDGMQHLVREIRVHGAAPRFDVLGAMIYYLDAFPERVHHPRESAYLFRLLRWRCPAAAPLIDALEDEHRGGAERIRILEQALTRYRQGGANEFDAFAKAVDAYAGFEAQHMRREERDLIPLAQKHLQPADWATIDAAFAGGALPPGRDGAGVDYGALFERIVALAAPQDEAR